MKKKNIIPMSLQYHQGMTSNKQEMKSIQINQVNILSSIFKSPCCQQQIYLNPQRQIILDIQDKKIDIIRFDLQIQNKLNASILSFYQERQAFVIIVEDNEKGVKGFSQFTHHKTDQLSKITIQLIAKYSGFFRVSLNRARLIKIQQGMETPLNEFVIRVSIWINQFFQFSKKCHQNCSELFANWMNLFLEKRPSTLPSTNSNETKEPVQSGVDIIYKNMVKRISKHRRFLKKSIIHKCKLQPPNSLISVCSELNKQYYSNKKVPFFLNICTLLESYQLINQIKLDTLRENQVFYMCAFSSTDEEKEFDSYLLKVGYKKMEIMKALVNQLIIESPEETKHLQKLCGYVISNPNKTVKRKVENSKFPTLLFNTGNEMILKPQNNQSIILISIEKLSRFFYGAQNYTAITKGTNIISLILNKKASIKFKILLTAAFKITNKELSWKQS